MAKKRRKKYLKNRIQKNIKAILKSSKSELVKALIILFALIFFLLIVFLRTSHIYFITNTEVSGIPKKCL